MGKQTASTESGAIETRKAMHEAAMAVQAERVERARRFIDGNFLRNPGLTEIAAHVGVSAFHFHRLFTVATGQSPKEYVDQLRIEEAKRRMLSGEPLASVASSLKWAHQSHFTSRFKQLVGDAPKKWMTREWLSKQAA